MITLHGSLPRFGLPSASPFVTKAEILLKMAGLPYRHVEASFARAPKGKIPFIEDDGRLIGDTEFIRSYLETKYGADFDKGLSLAEKGVARAFTVMADEHLYWTIVHLRWMNPRNFDRGPRHFFEKVPAPVRPVVVAMVKRKVRQSLVGQGLGRHAQAEIEDLAHRDIDAIASFIGSKPFLLGDAPCSADASVWPSVVGLLCPEFETPLHAYTAANPVLVAYAERGFSRWFPELERVMLG